jgi:hypothetical protein
MSSLIEPREALQVVTLDLAEGRPSNYQLARSLGMPEDESPLGFLYRSLVLGGKSNYLSNKLLDHSDGKTEFVKPTTVGLALCTTAPTATSTGATIVEAAYTGYTEKKLEAAVFNAAASQKVTSASIIELTACTAGSSTVVGWVLKDSTTVGSGNVLFWGTCSSTTINTTSTPPTVNAGALELQES